MTTSPLARRRVLLAALALAAAGCGTHEPMVTMTGDAQELSTLIDDWNDARGTPKAAARLFVGGKAPGAAQLKKYRDYSYALTGVPAVGPGDSATLPVSVTPERASGGPATLDWTFKKQEGAWKIDSAPLP